MDPQCVIGDKWFDISHLICGDLKGIDWCRDDEKCTLLGSNIANGMVKVAATRIFKDPAQCLVEMVVNSVDSYNQKMHLPKTGRFGMGFFSILYFLVGQPDNYLIINTKVATDKEYRLTIREINQKLSFMLEHVNESNKVFGNSQSGTMVNLKYSANSQTQFEKYFDYLCDLTTVKIIVIGKNIYELATGKVLHLDSDDPLTIFSQTISPGENGVIIKNSSDQLTVYDQAEGISLDTILGSLLIPSMSTKTLAQSRKITKYYNTSYFQPTTRGYFAITINQVHLVHLPMKFPFKIGLSLPSSVNVPVTRDDIIIDSPTKQFFLESINIILTEILTINFLHRPIHVLETALQLYFQHTVNGDNKNFLHEVNEFIRNKVSSVKEIAINIIDEPVYRTLQMPFITVLAADPFQVENKLKKWNFANFDRDFNSIPGKILIKMPLDATSNGGSISHIFVPEKFFHNIEELKFQYTAESLVPGDPLLEKFLAALPESAREYQDMTTKIYGRAKRIYDSLSSNDPKKFEAFIFGENPEEFSWIWEVKGLFLTFAHDSKTLIYLLTKYIQRLNLIGVKLSYGQPLPRINLFQTSMHELVNNADPGFVAKYLDFIWSRKNYMSEINSFFFVNRPELRTNAITKMSNFYLKNPTIDSWPMFVIFECFRGFEEDPIARELYQECTLDGVNFIEQIKAVYERYIRHMSDRPIVEITHSSNLRDAGAEILRWAAYKKRITNQLSLTKTEFSILGSLFTTKQLINYVFQNSSINLWTDLGKITKYSENLKLQTVEIAVNSGTTKPFIEAILTELVQNSIDAIRLTENSSKNINIDLSRTSDNKLQVAVTDYVGMTTANIISLMIPFYSTKVASKLVTGEMGTGFFNIYRETISVKVVTVKNNEKIILTSIPVRNQNGDVTDILNKLEKTVSSEENYTTISFIINNNSYSEFVHQITRIVNFAEDTIQLMDVILYLNKKKVKATKTTMAEGDGLFIYRTTAGAIRPKSYLFTNGVPAMLLTDLLLKDRTCSSEIIQIMDTGIAIDLPYGFYQPVQSRTMPSFNPERKKIFDTVVDRAIFLNIIQYCLERMITNDHNMPIPNYWSKVPLNQVLPKIYPRFVINIFPAYVAFFNSLIGKHPDTGAPLRMSEIIADYYNECKRQNKRLEFFNKENSDPTLTRDFADKYIDQICSVMHPDIAVSYLTIVDTYLKTKIISLEPEPDRKEEKETVEGILAIKYVKSFVDLVRRKAKTIDIIYPEFKVELSRESVTGLDTVAYFSPKENKLVVSVMVLAEFKNDILNFTQENWAENRFFKEYFSFIHNTDKFQGGFCSYIIHELEHIRRHYWANYTNNKSYGYLHSDLIIEDQTYDFNSSANYYFDKINQLGIYTEFQKIVNQKDSPPARSVPQSVP